MTKREYKKIWRANNKEKVRGQKSRYYSTEKGKFSKRKYQYGYNINFEEYQQLLVRQMNLCAICHRKESGEVRGLLCQKCNRALGGFGDDVALLKSALQYLS